MNPGQWLWLLSAVYVGGLVLGFFLYGYRSKDDDIFDMEEKHVVSIFLWPARLVIIVPVAVAWASAFLGKKAREIASRKMRSAHAVEGE